MWQSDWYLSGSIGGARKPRLLGKASMRIWSIIHCLNLVLFTICIHCRLTRELYWRAVCGKSASTVPWGALMFFHMAEYCDTPQSKERRNREYKACLNERAILRLLDQDVTWKSGCFPAFERGDLTTSQSVVECLTNLSLIETFWVRRNEANRDFRSI